ncbi:lipopolysaccharide biosynthesis protein [Sulfurovum sp. XTW-4]|uniref:Lipopolysaccharide biosynthesis protein n=1 Tax=Sulfurovum xiamenensis TaxID=3019066 RepID=A0ABT7QNJ2_9BACT|nr:lipopolysaccharide biosynthesis protein [Sulfurovum xiamenensis]MDM5262635.1 lipopolysaccharide biosynthesis protein [Sulfurovum xiamenensis]
MKNFNSNIFWSLLSQFSNYGLSLIFTIFLARMVLPYEYGIVDQAQTITAFFIIFADGGIVWSIVREKSIRNEEVINLSWINISLGLMLWILTWISAPYVSGFYQTPEVEDVLKALGFVFVLTGLATPFLMWMKRELEFKKITIINLISTTIGGVSAIVAAYFNYGYWSLVILALVKAFVQFILLLMSSRMPIGLYKFNTPVKKMIHFGVGLIGFGMVNYFARNLDNILIGKIGGAEELALYAKAYFLMFLPSMLITGALTGLMVSVLAKVQDDPAKFQEVYANVLRMIFVITLPITGYFLLFPSDPILLFYGLNWEGSIPLLQILSIAAITQPLYNTMGWVYTAIGKSKEMFHWGVVSSIILSVAFLVGVQWGAVGIAMSYSIVMGLIFVYVGLRKAHKAADICLKESFVPLLPVLGSGILTFMFVKNMDMYLSVENSYLTIFLKVITVLCLYIAFLYIIYKNKLKNLIIFTKDFR